MSDLVRHYGFPLPGAFLDLQPFPIQFFRHSHTSQLLIILGGKEVGGLIVIIIIITIITVITIIIIITIITIIIIIIITVIIIITIIIIIIIITIIVMSDLVRHYDFPIPDAFPHVVRTLANK
jgi:hypothetical protein